MVERVAIVSVPVSDPDAAKAWYTEKLGLRCRADNPLPSPKGMARWIEVAPEGATAALTLVTWFDAMPPGSQQGLVLSVDDVAATVAELRARGVEVSDPDTAPWGRFAVLRDPDGNGLVLQQG